MRLPLRITQIRNILLPMLLAAFILLPAITTPVMALESNPISGPVTLDIEAENSHWFIRNGNTTTDPVYAATDDVQEVRLLPSGEKELTNHSAGYVLTYPNSFKEDFSLSQVRGLLENETTRLEIYHDNFHGTVHSVGSYLNYSRGFLANTQDHQVQRRETLKINGLTAHYLEWTRTPLEAITNDKNHYAKVVFMVNSKEAYTLLFKSQQPFSNNDHWKIINSFQLKEKTTTPGIHARFHPVEKDWSHETQTFYNQYFVDSEELVWGIFDYGAPFNTHSYQRLESQLNYKFPFLLQYQNLELRYPSLLMEIAKANGRHVVLTLQTLHSDQQRNPRVLYNLLEGHYDRLLEEYAEGIKAYGEPVLFRLNNEMNGDWCFYSAYYSSMDPEIFNAAWRYVHDKFAEYELDNVLWVWNPHDGSFPGFQWNHYLTYYPGDEYVDIIGLTGYNPGTYFPGEKWKSFEEIYNNYYREYITLFHQPLMIPEFGSNSVGGDKIAWVQSMFENLPNYSRIKVAMWWNGIDWDAQGNPGRIYRLDETPEMIRVFNEGFSQFTVPEPSWREEALRMAEEKAAKNEETTEDEEMNKNLTEE